MKQSKKVKELLIEHKITAKNKDILQELSFSIDIHLLGMLKLFKKFHENSIKGK